MLDHLTRLGLVLALLTGGLLLVGTAPSYARDRDCGDFATQAAAQQYFLDQGGPQQDPDALDADGDGIACESNPCPCSTSQGGGGGHGVADVPRTRREKARIVRVVDGDTVAARLKRSGRLVTVRLVGIDTPEVYGGVECGGREASAATKRLLPRGTRVLLVSDPSQDLKDRYGRLLRYVVKQGVDVNRRLVRLGLAYVYVYDHHPFRRTDSYRSAARQARRQGLGVWGSC